MVEKPTDRNDAASVAAKPSPEEHRLAFEQAGFLWNMQRVPRTLPDGKTPHPARSCAIFVVHGIGKQRWTETAAHLRAGFENAFEEIVAWQEKNLSQIVADGQINLPPPFIYEGYWANYEDIQATFPEDWKNFNQREQTFFGSLWKQRVVSGARTIAWAFRQQVGLLHPKVFLAGPFAWILYWPFQIVSSVMLLYAWFRFPEVITGYLNDVRLYLEPRGVVERAIVQRIDERVASAFLRMIGLDRDFRPLDSRYLIEAGGERFAFSRVVWVAHSLGTVISYNVLSALFRRAEELAAAGDPEQQEGVMHFRQALSRFVTMGSPLDKVAFLFKRESLRPWPGAQRRRALIPSGETVTTKDPTQTEWWVNFYHVLDPVSGALASPFLSGDQPPSNIHIRRGFLPGIAHVAYWKDPSCLRFILGRTYGASFLKDKEYRPLSPRLLSVLAAAAYCSWAAILFGAVYAFYHYAPSILRSAGAAALKWITG